MGIEALLIAAAVAGSPAADCAAAGAKQPALRKVIDAAAALRQAASQPEASFSRLVAQAKSLSSLGKSALSQIQEAGCADEAQTALLEACTAPLTWSCESVPPGIDWSFLSRVKRSEDEDLALSLGDPILAGPVNLFATCCGDSMLAEAARYQRFLLPAPDEEPRDASFAYDFFRWNEGAPPLRETRLRWSMSPSLSQQRDRKQFLLAYLTLVHARAPTGNILGLNAQQPASASP